MPPFAECCVIIPCSTIEDFPSRLDSAGARSLLGGLTVAWHPRLIAATRRTPSWHRSDEAPPPIRIPALAVPAAGDPQDGQDTVAVDREHTAPSAAPTSTLRRLLIIPEVCVSTLPADVREGIDRDAVSRHDMPTPQDTTFHDACEVRIRVSSRGDALEKMAGLVALFSDEHADDANASLSDETSWHPPTDAVGGIDERDFFALGYMWWQTQVLTRRLRYTSNLDQVYFESRLVAAAEQFVAGDVAAATDSLHDCYDALAGERDHYFSSDPALVDLTLLTPGTLDSWLDGLSHPETSPEADAAATPRTGLATPENVLVDESVAAAILQGDPDRRTRFRACLKVAQNAAGARKHEAIGWCGGGPASDFSFDASSIAACEQRIAEAVRTVQESGAAPLAVYARLGGGVAGEWVPAIAAAGFRGIIPIDFLGGRGYDDESKVLLGEGDYEIEALTAKPIDADDDASFLTLSAKLGEAIDRGEIATALMAHWPGGGCDSFHDVRRAASWSLCLGKFWRIDEYFTEGERPFHHGSAPSAAPAPVQTVGDLYERRTQLLADLTSQRNRNLGGMAALLAPSSGAALAKNPTVQPENTAELESEFCQQIATSLGYTVDVEAVGSSDPSANLLLLHPSQPAVRTALTVAGKVTADTAPIFHAESSGSLTRVIADIPAWGFALVGTAATRQAGDDANLPSPVQRFMRLFSGGPGRMIEGNRFSNEFMEVTIDQRHGGIDAVYSGPGRGNRFSMRLLVSPRSNIDPESKTDATDSRWETICTGLETLEDTRHRAVMELQGEFRLSADAMSAADPSDAEPLHRHPTKWQAQYSVERGSRRLLYRVRFDTHVEPTTSIADAWNSAPVLRMAMAEAAPIVRAISREKLVRTSARSFTSSLGFVIDEESRTTLIACPGAAAHRRSGERFFDTIVAAEQLVAADQLGRPGSAGDDAEWTPWQSYAFGFDVRQTVESAKSLALGDQLCRVPVTTTGKGASSQSFASLSQRGWLLHPKPISLDVQVVSVGRVIENSDGPECMALHLRVIQTAGRSVAASLRFCRDLHSAYQVSPLSRPFQNEQLPGILTFSQLAEISNPESMTCQGDRVSWTQGSHGVVHIVVLFPLSDPA